MGQCSINPPIQTDAHFMGNCGVVVGMIVFQYNVHRAEVCGLVEPENHIQCKLLYINMHSGTIKLLREKLHGLVNANVHVLG